MKQKTFRFFLDLMLLICLALAGCGLQAYAQAQLSISLLITPAFLLLAAARFSLGACCTHSPLCPGHSLPCMWQSPRLFRTRRMWPERCPNPGHMAGVFQNWPQQTC